MLHCLKQCGRTGVRWFAAHDRLITLRDKIRLRWPLSLGCRRGGRDNRTMLRCTKTVRAHWREVIHRARPVDSTARLDLGGDSVARLDLGVDSVARTDLGVDSTVRADLGVDDTVRADLGVDDTVRADLGVDGTGRLDPDTVAVTFGFAAAVNSRTILRCTRLCGRIGVR